MRLPNFFRIASPEFLVGVFHAFLWVLLALQVTMAVIAPLASAATALQRASVVE